jgi:hypothetical protein
MIKILGSGWIKKNKCGLKVKVLTYKYSDLKALYLFLKEAGVFNFPVENFARFDRDSKLASIAVGLALYDANIVCRKDKKQDIGIIAANKHGALEAQLAYFKDYLKGGRILGRGNLFIYTLPSSPLAEAAIHFGLQGPLIYFNLPGSRGHFRLKEYAKELINDGQARRILVLYSQPYGITCSLLGA